MCIRANHLHKLYTSWVKCHIVLYMHIDLCWATVARITISISIYDTLSIFPLETKWPQRTRAEPHLACTWRIHIRHRQPAQRPIYIAINTSTLSISTLTPNVCARASMGRWSHIRAICPFRVRRDPSEHARNLFALRRLINPLSPSESAPSDHKTVYTL